MTEAVSENSQGSHPVPRRQERHILNPGNRLSDLTLAALRRTADLSLTAIYGTWPYRQTLHGPMPDTITHYPKDLRPGRVDKADALFQGRYDLPGGQVRTNGLSPFEVEAPSETWTEELHGFSWVRHFSAAGGNAARAHARGLVQSWIATSGQWHDIGWRPHVIGRRLTSWAANGALLMEESDLIYRSTLLRNMAKQARHLARTVMWAPPGEQRLTAAIGLAFSGLCLSEGGKRLRKGLDLVGQELTQQILPDGGHISRNPAAQLSILLDLVSLRDALIAQGHGVPQPIRNAVDRMMPMLRFFKHGDGKLALFNGADEGPDGAVEAALAEDDAKGKPFGFAPHSGYQRMSAGPTYVTVDTGPPPPGAYSHSAHAGCLSFEMSVGRCRLVTNCGATRILGADWHAASRATAAHSTLVLNDTSSARFTQGALSRILLGSRLMEGPARVESRRNESEEGIWLDAAHDGYRKLFGFVHRRRLFLSASGEDLRGEDSLTRAPDEPSKLMVPFKQTRDEVAPAAFAIRFHLHPDARASLAHDKSNVLVLLPNGDGWQFRARTENGKSSITLEESVYLGSADRTRRSEQIVVTGEAFRDEATVHWAWRRLSTTGNADKAEADEPELPALPAELPGIPEETPEARSDAKNGPPEQSGQQDPE